MGKTDFDLFPEKKQDAQRFYDEEQAIMEIGRPVIYRQWMVPSTATGGIVWLSESKLPIRAATQMARVTNGILEPYELTQQIVNLVQDRFHLYQRLRRVSEAIHQ